MTPVLAEIPPGNISINPRFPSFRRHGTDEDGAVAIRERIRSHIAVYNEQRTDYPLPISFSMGYAIRKTPEDTVEAMMILADERMYQDKSKSRSKT